MKSLSLLVAVVMSLSLAVLAAAGAVAPGAVEAVGATGGARWPAPPAPMARIYVLAASTCPGLGWQVLAAIGTVESGNGTSELPGVRSGQNGAGAEGPMQFEPSTFAIYSQPVPPGGAHPPSPYDPVDAVYAAARMLCADGGANPARLPQAVFDYNHSAAYVREVLAMADAYGLGDAASGLAGRTGAGLVALRFALAQVGTPYRWGGEQAGVGFDCSGLAQAAWAAAGVSIPRVADDQMKAGRAVQATEPGDLVFFGPPGGPASHVGLVVDPSGLMVDAPHSGAAVRVDRFDPRPGSLWGTEILLGATHPVGSAN